MMPESLTLQAFSFGAARSISQQTRLTRQFQSLLLSTELLVNVYNHNIDLPG